MRLEAAAEREEREMVFQAAMVANLINACSQPGRLKRGVTAMQLLGREKLGKAWDDMSDDEKRALLRRKIKRTRPEGEQQAETTSATV